MDHLPSRFIIRNISILFLVVVICLIAKLSLNRGVKDFDLVLIPVIPAEIQNFDYLLIDANTDL